MDNDFEAETVASGFSNTLIEERLMCRIKNNDLQDYLTKLSSSLEKRLKHYLGKFKNFKFWVALDLTYGALSNSEKEVEAHLRAPYVCIFNEFEIPQKIVDIISKISIANENFVREKSGLTIKSINNVRVHIAKVNPLSGKLFVPLPKFLKSKKAIVNVFNRDNRCFGYAILSALLKTKVHPERTISYDDKFTENGLDKIHFPVALNDIPMTERKLSLKINVFSFFDDEGKGRYPVYISSIEEDFPEVDLLYWSDHWAWIKNFSRFCYDLNEHKTKKYICKRCFSHFYDSEKLENHKIYCSRPDYSDTIFSLPAPGTFLKFENVKYSALFPFVIYADFECLTVPIDESTTSHRNVRTHIYQKHQACAIGFKLFSYTYNTNLPTNYFGYCGPDCANWFLSKIREIKDKCLEVLFDEKRLNMTKNDWQKYSTSTHCSICGGPFSDESTFHDRKVRDHDHITGCYRGAAHSRCNLSLRSTYKIPIFFHNFKGYDSHIIVLASNLTEEKISLIASNMEKYIILNWGENLVFKDSLQFLNSSLDTLAKSLLKSGRDRFSSLISEFPDITEEQISLLFRKGVFPYDYLNSWAKLEEASLPSKEQFSNILTGKDISEDDYLHAQNVWAKFECKTIKDYMLLYLKTDVLLLTDIFQEFRRICKLNYDLDPVYYISSPQLSWDAMFKTTKCKLELISDAEMFSMIDSAIRGGITVISARFAHANNPYMKSFYNPNEPTSYIIYLDANNLYGTAMNEPLPYQNFEWVPKEKYEQIDWLAQADDQQIGYIIECDLEYPTALHNEHNDYPLAPERIRIGPQMLSDTQILLRGKYEMSETQSHVKLVPNLFDKENYCCHYRLLKFYLNNGMKLKRVNRVLSFKQSAWMASYIKLNQGLRAKSQTDFEKDFFKLMVNSCYGKTVENQKNHSDIRLVSKKSRKKTLIEKPHCLGFRLFNENLAAIQLRKLKCVINKPFYVGFTVLELSKLHMYNFHYNVIQKLIPNNKLLFTDTDSLMYHCFCPDVYHILWSIRDQMDFSGYPSNPPISLVSSPDIFISDNSNAKVLGKFKDEANGDPIVEFVGLRPKMYSYITLKDLASKSVKGKQKAKGVQRSVVERLTHDDFLSQLKTPLENRLSNKRICSKLHVLYSTETCKRGLCAFDDKRYILDDGISTLSYGHYKIGNSVTMKTYISDIPKIYKRVKPSNPSLDHTTNKKPRISFQ